MTIVSAAQIALSIALIVLILLQRSEAGLGSAFGGGDDTGPRRTRRGAEQIVFYTTVVLAVLFVGLSIYALIV